MVNIDTNYYRCLRLLRTALGYVVFKNTYQDDSNSVKCIWHLCSMLSGCKSEQADVYYTVSVGELIITKDNIRIVMNSPC